MTLILDKGLTALEAFDFDGLKPTEKEVNKSVSGIEEM